MKFDVIYHLESKPNIAPVLFYGGNFILLIQSILYPLTGSYTAGVLSFGFILFYIYLGIEMGFPKWTKK